MDNFPFNEPWLSPAQQQEALLDIHKQRYTISTLAMSPQEEQEAWELIYADMDDNGYFDDLDCSLQDGPPQPFNGDEPF
jgi:hypothetical protein